MQKHIRVLALALALFAFCLPLTGCGVTADAQRVIGESSRYSPAQLEAAMPKE